jgi:hypothetical protein
MKKMASNAQYFERNCHNEGKNQPADGASLLFFQDLTGFLQT